MREEVGAGADSEFFVGLCQLAGDADFSVGEMGRADFERFWQAMRGLEEDAGHFALHRGADVALAASAFWREEAAVEKRFGGKSAADERGEDGARAGQDRVRQAALDAGAQEPVAGVADSGKACVGDDGDVFPTASSSMSSAVRRASLCSW